MTAYCHTCKRSRALIDLRLCNEFVEQPGVGLTGKCRFCDASVTFVVSVERYEELAITKEIRDGRHQKSKGA